MVWAVPDGAAQPCLGQSAGTQGLDSSSPAEVIVEIFGGDAMERSQPFLESAVIAVDVVDVVDVEIGRLWPWPAGRWKDVAGDFRLASEGDDRLAAIAAQLVGRRDDAGERGGDRGPVEFGQNRIGGGAVSVAGDQYRDLLRRQASLGGFSASLARGAREIGPLALERLQDKGLIRFDDPGEAGRLIE